MARILLTGGTGAAGAAALRAAAGAGHEVVAVVRNETAARTVEALGARPLLGNLADPDWVKQQLAQADGAIHAAGGPLGAAQDFEPVIVDSVIEVFAPSGKPFVTTGGMLSYGSGIISETSSYDPIPSMVERARQEERLLASGVKASIIQPARVYGREDRLIRLLASGYAPAAGELRLLGSGEQHWPLVHADDLGALYLVLLEKAPGGERYIAASAENPSVRELSAALAGPDITLVPEDVKEFQARFGEVAELALRDQQAAMPTLATRRFGWTATSPNLADLLAEQYRPRLAELAATPAF